MMARHIPEARIVVPPNPIVARPPRRPQTHCQPQTHCRPETHCRPQAHPEPLVLFVGKLDARKGYSDLLAAARIVLAELPAAQFWFAGHGEVDRARALSAQLGIAHAVHLPGWVASTALDDLFARATVLALPSYGEGVPMSVIEAMSHAVPVVCTPVGGLPELVVDGENGLFVQPGAVPAQAAALLRLLRDPQLAAKIGAAGWTTVQRTCTVEAVSEQLEALYAEVLAEAQSRKLTPQKAAFL